MILIFFEIFYLCYFVWVSALFFFYLFLKAKKLRAYEYKLRGKISVRTVKEFIPSKEMILYQKNIQEDLEDEESTQKKNEKKLDVSDAQLNLIGDTADLHNSDSRISVKSLKKKSIKFDKLKPILIEGE